MVLNCLTYSINSTPEISVKKMGFPFNPNHQMRSEATEKRQYAFILLKTITMSVH